MNTVKTPATPAPLDARALGAMLLLCTLWSLQQLSLKAIAPLASPMLVVGLRSALALALLGLVMRGRGARLQRRHLRPGLAVGALFALEYLLVALALPRTQAAHVVVFLYTAPVFAALGLHAWVPGERLGRRQWAGIALAFGGIALAFLARPAGAHPAPDAVDAGLDTALNASLGDLLALGGGLAWAATTLVLRRSTLAQAPATEALAWQLGGAAALLLPAALALGHTRLSPVPAVWGHLAFQALVVSFASFLLWFALLRRYQAGPLGVLSFGTPVLGVLLGALLLGERLSGPFLAGGAAVLAGVALVSLPRRGMGGAAGPAQAPGTRPCRPQASASPNSAV